MLTGLKENNKTEWAYRRKEDPKETTKESNFQNIMIIKKLTY